MGLVGKSNMEKYWSQDRVISTPFFGRYMSKSTFQLLLANIHMNDNSKYIPYGHQNHDPLFKIRPFQDMCKTGSNWYIHLNVNSHLMRVDVHTKAAFAFVFIILRNPINFT